MRVMCAHGSLVEKSDCENDQTFLKFVLRSTDGELFRAS